MLRMKTISKDEIQGLAKVFSLYTKFPKERWPEIKIAEKSKNLTFKLNAKVFRVSQIAKNGVKRRV